MLPLGRARVARAWYVPLSALRIIKVFSTIIEVSPCGFAVASSFTQLQLLPPLIVILFFYWVWGSLKFFSSTEFEDLLKPSLLLSLEIFQNPHTSSVVTNFFHQWISHYVNVLLASAKETPWVFFFLMSARIFLNRLTCLIFAFLQTKETPWVFGVCPNYSKKTYDRIRSNFPCERDWGKSSESAPSLIRTHLSFSIFKRCLLSWYSRHTHQTFDVSSVVSLW